MNSHEREEKRREEKRREEKYYTLANFLSFKLFIALLSLILFFSISCKSNEEPTEIPPVEPTEPTKPPTPTTKHELEGTWIGYDTNHHNSKVELKIDSDGNVTLTPQPAIDYDNSLYPYTYKGKVETNAIVYPYAVKISNLMIDYMDKETKEKRVITFKNSSSCSVYYMRLEGWTNPYDPSINPTTVEFTKQ